MQKPQPPLAERLEAPLPTASSGSTNGFILDAVTEKVVDIFHCKALLLKRLALDRVPMKDMVQELGAVALKKTETNYEGERLPVVDRDQTLDEIVTSVAKTSAEATRLLHTSIDETFPNRPFGGTVDVERLIIENLRLMETLCEDISLDDEAFS